MKNGQWVTASILGYNTFVVIATENETATTTIVPLLGGNSMSVPTDLLIKVS